MNKKYYDFNGLNILLYMNIPFDNSVFGIYNYDTLQKIIKLTSWKIILIEHNSCGRVIAEIPFQRFKPNSQLPKHTKPYLVSVYNAENYIGNPEQAVFLINLGIKNPLPLPFGLDFKKYGRGTCCIGYSDKDNKWYGWSHRSYYGFGVGDIAKEGDCTTISGLIPEYLKDHPEEDYSVPVGFEVKTLNDARRMAIAFAESVA